jgi:FGGY-family pentulose kinase/HAD superfamily hydrolase (TIGR01509 family)
MPPPIGLIIFDCDGVLVDSELLAMRVLVAAIEAQGGGRVAPADAFRNYLGRSLESISKSLAESHSVTLGDDALAAMRNDLFSLYRRELKPVPWIEDVLDRIDVPRCVASSSGLERIRFSLDVTGLLPRFGDRIFSASMVEHGKPAPDLFLHAAREMGVAPQNCLVIEDSPAGVRAAKAAGMRVFAFLGGSHVEAAGIGGEIESLAPDARLNDMRTLPGLVALHQARADGTPPNILAAVDVGTTSARAGLLSSTGDFLARAESPFSMHRPDADIAEHDSEEIWSAACRAVGEALAWSGVAASEVVGLSFDATCSLVVRDARHGQVTVSATGDDRLDTISWMDHRAQAEAAEVTATGHPVLDRLGGVVSPEMQVPKLMWLKRHLPASWNRAALLFDLSDFLAWKATGSLARSQCTLTCKWNYLPDAGGWQHDFLELVGLDDLLARGSLPADATPIGAAIGRLTPDAAAALGLAENCVVGMGLIDAHAGALSVIGDFRNVGSSAGGHLTHVGGTSSCIMAVSSDPRPIHGVWGPFLGAVLPNVWLNEAGQSATGALLEHLIASHPAGGKPTSAMHASILLRIAELRAAQGDNLGARLHLLPDFHGNRSPLGEPMALGVAFGLTLDESFDGLCRLYYRAAVAIAMGDRHILETLARHGYDVSVMHVVGGHVHNPLLMELYADVSATVLLEPLTIDATLLGVAMAAAAAANLHPSLDAAAAAMAPLTRRREPNPHKRARYDAEYEIFKEMTRSRAAVDQLIARLPVEGQH